MAERRIFGPKFEERYKDDEMVTRLVEKVEGSLEQLMEQHGVSTWEELPLEVLESFDIRVTPQEVGLGEDDNV